MEMGSEFHFRDQVPVAVLGATGIVGQRLVSMLAHHPWFSLVAVSASDRSVGKTYRNAVDWKQTTPLPEAVGNLQIQPCEPNRDCPLVFSCLDASVAGPLEVAFAEAGCLVISNTCAHRLDENVPLVIPEINYDHLELLKQQAFGKGHIVTNPNCAAIGLALALKPLQERFGIEAVHVTTLQAISGAGSQRPDIDDNVIPFIAGEEEKIEKETVKILGTYSEKGVVPAQFTISAQTNRVPVTDGHLACVGVKLTQQATEEVVIEAWTQFQGMPQKNRFPTAPEHPIHYLKEQDAPQPKYHRDRDGGMSLTIGRLRPCSLFDYKFTILSHNTVRGAAGAALLNAELVLTMGYVYW